MADRKLWWVTKYATTSGVIVCPESTRVTRKDARYVWVDQAGSICATMLRRDRDAFETEAAALLNVIDRWRRKIASLQHQLKAGAQRLGEAEEQLGRLRGRT